MAQIVKYGVNQINQMLDLLNNLEVKGQTNAQILLTVMNALKTQGEVVEEAEKEAEAEVESPND